MSEFRHTRLISEYDSATGKFINYLELGDTSTTPDTPVDLRFRVPGYIENVHTIYFEGDHGDSYEAGISTSKPSGVVHDLVFFDPQNASGKTLSELAASGMPSDPVQGDVIYYNGTSWARLAPGTPDNFLQTKGAGANPVWAASSGGAGLWQDTGTYAELIAAEDITIQSKNITGINGITMESEKDGINMSDSPLTNAGGITMSDAINMGGNGISNAYVVKANGTSGVEFRPYDYAVSGDELLNIADGGFAFISGANASMDGNDLSYVKAINGTTTIPLHLNFCGNDPATHEIWREGDDLKFKDATATGTKTLSQLATGGGDYVHPDQRQCTLGTWAWNKISSIPSTLEYTTHKNVADGYCGIGNDGYMPTIGLLPSMITGSLYVANELHTMVELPVGTIDGCVLTVNSSETLGVEWAAGGSSSAFIGLSDTPTDYTGAAGKFVKVNSVPDGLEFVAGGNGESLWESPASETYLTTPEPVNLQGQSLKNMGSRYGKLNTLQQWYYNSTGGGVVKKMELSAVAMNMWCPLNMNGDLIENVDIVRAYGEGGVRFKQSNTEDIRLQVAYSGYAFVANANANMNTHNIINVAEIKGTTNQDIYVKPLGDGILYLG